MRTDLHRVTTEEMDEPVTDDFMEWELALYAVVFVLSLAASAVFPWEWF